MVLVVDIDPYSFVFVLLLSFLSNLIDVKEDTVRGVRTSAIG